PPRHCPTNLTAKLAHRILRVIPVHIHRVSKRATRRITATGSRTHTGHIRPHARNTRGRRNKSLRSIHHTPTRTLQTERHTLASELTNLHEHTRRRVNAQQRTRRIDRITDRCSHRTHKTRTERANTIHEPLHHVTANTSHRGREAAQRARDPPRQPTNKPNDPLHARRHRRTNSRHGVRHRRTGSVKPIRKRRTDRRQRPRHRRPSRRQTRPDTRHHRVKRRTHNPNNR